MSYPIDESLFANAVRKALAKARAKHGPMHTPHEAYGVLMEEVCEFFDEARRQEYDLEAMLTELVHIGAMAQRAAEDLELIRGD